MLMSDHATPQKSKPRASSAVRLGHPEPAKRILIVEDDRMVAENLQEMLQLMGYVVTDNVSSGEEAVKRVAEILPDLVLTDIYLRGKLDGIEAARLITKNHGVPVVYLTAHSNHSVQERLKLDAPFGYVLKPFDQGELRIVIEIALFRGSTETKLKKLNQELQEALTQIRTLSNLLPICAWCKKVRDDDGYWQQLEEYITIHSPTKLTHGICPDCSVKVLANPKKARH